jgi:hypothetical protein
LRYFPGKTEIGEIQVLTTYLLSGVLTIRYIMEFSYIEGFGKKPGILVRAKLYTIPSVSYSQQIGEGKEFRSQSPAQVFLISQHCGQESGHRI